MVEFIIRPATAPDVPAITAIVCDAYTKYIERIGKPPGPMLDDYALLVDEHAVWVHVDGEAIRGVLVMTGATDHLLLENVAVDPRYQGEGIGLALIDFAESEARRRGCREIRLYTHEQMHENIAMYHHLGYEEHARGEAAGYRRVFFRKALG